MDASLLVQYTVIALAVVLSAAYVARRQFPAAVRTLRLMFAIPMVRVGMPRWMQRLGRTIAPPTQSAGGDCGACNGCGPTD